MTDELRAQEEIAAHRGRIDEIDCEIVRLLNERAAESLAIRALKPQVHWGLYDPKREEGIFAHLPAALHRTWTGDDGHSSVANDGVGGRAPFTAHPRISFMMCRIVS